MLIKASFLIKFTTFQTLILANTKNSCHIQIVIIQRNAK